MKKTVLHVIESLAVGGAEILLTEALKGFSDTYRHVVVYMRQPATLLPLVKSDKIYCLGYRGKANWLGCMYKLRRIIERENTALIHAHHYWPTIIARLAKPKATPLLFTIHSPLSQDAFHLNRLSLYLEKLTYRKEHHALFVSRTVLEDYDRHVGVKGKSAVLYNFATNYFFDPKYTYVRRTTPPDEMRLVALGNLKPVKNYTYLLEVFALLKDKEMYLDIFGEGDGRSNIEALIKRYGLHRVRLRGRADQVHELLQKYDVFIQASKYEGLSLAVIEAMAVGLPCVLSDIPSSRELTGDAALFFDLASPDDCAQKLAWLSENNELRLQMSAASKKMALNYRKGRYLKELEAIYNQYI